MILSELRQDTDIITWLDNLNGSKQTVKSYLQAMQAFTEFTKLSPEELLTEAENEAHNRQRKLKGYLIGFRKSQQDKGLADLTVRARMAGVKSFYESFEIVIPKLQGDRRRPRTIPENNEIPTKEDLQECLNVCDPLERAVLLVGASSGLASQEVRDLKLMDFIKGIDSTSGACVLHVTRQKTGTSFYTFLSAEAVNAVNDYLAYRNRETKAAGEKRENQLKKQRTTEDSYLFILRSVPEEYLTTGNEKLRQMTENAVLKLYRSISEKARKNTKEGSYNVIRSHTMRKYFNSAMLNAGADSFFTEFVIGHTLDDTRAAYFRASPNELLKIYLKFMPHITIQKEVDVAASPEYREIAKENDILRAETARHIVERQEISVMENRFKRLAERQLKTDIREVETLYADGKISKEERDLQLAILKIGYKTDIGEITEAEGNKQIEKLMSS